MNKPTSERPSVELLRQWARDKDNTQCWGLGSIADELESSRKRLAAINTVACYVSEEDTDSRYQGLIEIGKIARGERDDG